MLKNDYIIVNDRINSKDDFYLAKVMALSGNEVIARVEDDCHIPNDNHTVTVVRKHIEINLGASPRPGFVYGCDLNKLYQGKKFHETFGQIHFFYKPEKDVGSNLFRALDKSYKILKARNLEFLVEDIVYEVLAFNKEKYAGYYTTSRKENVMPRVAIRPECMSSSDYTYVMLHELSHHLDFKFLTDKKLRAYWIRLFNTSIKPVTTDEKVSIRLLNDLLDQEDKPSDFKSSLSEEDSLAYKMILRTISTVNGISVHELDTLFEAEMFDDIRELWPSRTIYKKELDPVITEYATKNVRECLAEAVSFHLVGKKLPKQVVKLVEKTLSFVANNKE